MKNQKQFVIKHLEEYNEISRNFCLQNFISRLGALVCVLRKEGWDFRTESRNGDYIYIVKNKTAQAPLGTNNTKTSQYTFKQDKTPYSTKFQQKTMFGKEPEPKQKPHYEYN